MLSFVIINGRGNCGLVRPGDDEGSKVDARETVPPSRRLCCLMIGNQERSALRATRRSPPDRCYAASRHSYRWCSPPTLGSATTFAVGEGRGVIGLSSGVSLPSPKWQRSS